MGNHEKRTAIARHYTEGEEFWLGYRCRKCGLRFEDIQRLQKHSVVHQRIKSGICQRCGKEGSIQTHHITYKPEVTMNLCSTCHGVWHAENTPNWGKLKGKLCDPV